TSPSQRCTPTHKCPAATFGISPATSTRGAAAHRCTSSSTPKARSGWRADEELRSVVVSLGSGSNWEHARSAQHGVVAPADLAAAEAQIGEAAQQALECDLRLEARELRAEAVVQAVAERQRANV